MSDDTWVDQNNRYLAASLEWLRLRLAALVPPEPAPPAAQAAAPVPAAAPVAASAGWRFWDRGAAAAVDAPKLLEHSATTPSEREQHLRDAAKARDDAGQADPPPALLLLAERLELTPFERDTLLLCAALEYDPAVASLCARIQGHPARGYPTFGLALSLFDDPGWAALSAPRPLRFAHLVEPALEAGLPLTASPLRADERIVNYIKGLNVMDERLAAVATPLRDEAPALAPSQQAVAERVLDRLRVAAADDRLPAVQLVGTDAGSRLAVARRVCAALGRRLYRLDVAALPAQPGASELLARLWQRESMLLPVALYIDTDDAPADALAPLRRFLAQEMGVLFVAVADAPLAVAADTVTVDVARPDAGEQYDAWLSALDVGAGHDESNDAAPADTRPDDPRRAIARRLAGQFSMNAAAIRTVAAQALAAGKGDDTEGDDTDGALGERLWDACRELLRPRLDALARHLEAKAGWDDLVLPDEQMAIMRRIAGQVRERQLVYGDWGFGRRMNRGLGISALFAGESGTGKTMAAEVIARDLRLNLYRIDLSAVVSKYIGETEKNLRRLFDAAEQGGAILFFDEADALFGKRSEVRDSHDRYANIEINYLLQRMESFGGLAILATNMKSALDPAFMRRLRFIVNFPFPGLAERSRIWAHALPPETPAEALDYARLARLNVSGANIHSIALNAAFMAAEQGQPVTMATMLAAARSELKKLDKPVSEAEFR
jgi:ATPase family associated with various cellular activities (AAA)